MNRIEEHNKDMASKLFLRQLLMKNFKNMIGQFFLCKCHSNKFDFRGSTSLTPKKLILDFLDSGDIQGVPKKLGLVNIENSHIKSEA